MAGCDGVGWQIFAHGELTGRSHSPVEDYEKEHISFPLSSFSLLCSDRSPSLSNFGGCQCVEDLFVWHDHQNACQSNLHEFNPW